MQLMEFCFGVATSTEVAYYAYIYAKVSRTHHKQVTSYTRMALLVGKFASGLASQLLISTGVADYRSVELTTTKRNFLNVVRG